MEKQNVAHSYNGILFSNNEGHTIDMLNKMDEPQMFLSQIPSAKLWG